MVNLTKINLHIQTEKKTVFSLHQHLCKPYASNDTKRPFTFLETNLQPFLHIFMPVLMFFYMLDNNITIKLV